MEKKSFPYARAISVAIFLFAFFILSSDDVVSCLQDQLHGGLVGYGAYVLALILAVVLAPITVLPLIPAAAGIFGPFVTGVLSVAGWTIGAGIAFLIARYAGRPILSFFASLEDIEKLEAKFPQKDTFLGLVLLRMIVPVDILSYAVGLLSSMPLSTYLYATALGVAPFSFVFAYAGGAFAEGSYLTFAGIGVLGIALFWYIARRMRRFRADTENASQE